MIVENYPRAWSHLKKAHEKRDDLVKSWGSWLESEPFKESVVTDPQGNGQVTVTANWGRGQREELTAYFRACVTELWAALDSLVSETVQNFSVQNRSKHPKQPRFFPVADSGEGFDALLADASLDGVLLEHYQMIRDCQPYQPDSGMPKVDKLRDNVRRLAEWEHSVHHGSQIGAWATPVNPKIKAESPMAVEKIEISSPGWVEKERVLAEYRIVNYQPGKSIKAQAGAYVDLRFPEDFNPSDEGSNFGRRLDEALESAVTFAAYFSWFSSQVSVSTRVLNRQEPMGQLWVESNKSMNLWSDTELEKLTKSDLGLGRVVDAQSLTLLVSTPSGAFERRVPQPTPLRALRSRGAAAEVAIQGAAATWGLPDFVIKPSLETKGAAVREISDGLLVVGSQGVIVQAKAREAEIRSTDKEQGWVKKQVRKASAQIDGTARRLQSEATEMRNGRDRAITIDGPSIDWVGVVIIDHPDPPLGLALDFISSKTSSIVLLRRDWEFLFEQLRSTYAVVNYLHRVGGSTESLGVEPERYYELAIADLAAEPSDPPPVIVGVGESLSVPLLPVAPAGVDDDVAHRVVRDLLEDIATSKIECCQRATHQSILASIDSLPVAFRTELGQLLLEALDASRETAEDAIRWQFRTYLGGVGRAQLGFGVCSQFSDKIHDAFTSWLQLRHHEHGARVGDFVNLRSIGVLITPRHDDYRDWDTTVVMIEGALMLSVEELHTYRELWNS